jgi:hypothetical protein
MLTFIRFLSTVSLAVAASGAYFNLDTLIFFPDPFPTSPALVTNIVPPASKGTWDDPSNALDLTGTETDSDAIASTANLVDQKSGAAGDVDPNPPVPPVTVTAVDGTLTNTTVTRRSTPATGLFRRDASDYELVFSGSGTGPTDRDASIEGTAYLTFTLVPNSTYNVNACLDFCSSVETCGTTLSVHPFTLHLIIFVKYSPTSITNSIIRVLKNKHRT